MTISSPIWPTPKTANKYDVADLLAEDRFDRHFDRNVGDDLSPISQAGFNDVALEDGLVSHRHLTWRSEDHLHLLHTQITVNDTDGSVVGNQQHVTSHLTPTDHSHPAASDTDGSVVGNHQPSDRHRSQSPCCQ